MTGPLEQGDKQKDLQEQQRREQQEKLRTTLEARKAAEARHQNKANQGKPEQGLGSRKKWT
jgi:hypothetical protein